ATDAIWRCHQRKRRGFKGLLATADRPTQRRAERAPHHDGRPRLWRLQHFWGRDSDAGHGSDREGGIALHTVPFHCALLADARGAHYGSKPPLGWLWRDRRNVHRLPRL